MLHKHVIVLCTVGDVNKYVHQRVDINAGYLQELVYSLICSGVIRYTSVDAENTYETHVYID